MRNAARRTLSYSTFNPHGGIMRFKTVFVALVVLGLFAVQGFAGEKFQIDVSHSNVAFTVRHMGIAKVNGEFKKFSGAIVYDDKDISKSSVNVVIHTASIDTENENRDNHLRSEDFFNVAKDSLITFSSKKVEKKGDGYVAIGDFTLRGVTKEIALPFTILGTMKDQKGETRMGVEAKTTINRFDYGVKWDRTFEPGNLVVGKDVDITLNIEAKAPKAEAAN
jgi:polyisoprenoid-binding protein YceI